MNIVKNFAAVADAQVVRTDLQSIFSLITSGIPCFVVSKHVYDGNYSTTVYVPALNQLHRATHTHGVRVYLRHLCMHESACAKLLGDDEIYSATA